MSHNLFSICKKSANFHRLQVIFAHQDEPIPPDFLYPEMPAHLTSKQQQKWKSRRLAAFLLSEWLKNDDLNLSHIQKTASGRPFLEHPELDFNLSHSGEWLALILSSAPQKKVVGIDVEQPQKARDYLKLLDYFASPNEKLAFIEKKMPFHLLKDNFYLSWCLREAILKSQGVGIIKLSEVDHHPLTKRIYSSHCPAGIFHFYNHLPFYLGYFYQTEDFTNDLSPILFEYKQQHLIPVSLKPNLIYTVNKE